MNRNNKTDTDEKQGAVYQPMFIPMSSFGNGGKTSASRGVSGVTSYGVILVSIDGIDLSKLVHEVSPKMVSYNCTTQIHNRIKFLLVSRKNSLGLIEFIRGKYNPALIEQTVYLFRQMTSLEIKLIKQSLTDENGFDTLWDLIWGETNNIYIIKDKPDAKHKYLCLKNAPHINLEFIVKNVVLEYDDVEWGFPKGRKHYYELIKDCAIREFVEETGYNATDIRLIDDMPLDYHSYPLTETFIGTNGIRYKHVYYVAELLNRTPDVPKSNSNEIGSAELCTYETAIQLIRKHHRDRKNILKYLLVYYLSKLNEQQQNDSV